MHDHFRIQDKNMRSASRAKSLIVTKGGHHRVKGLLQADYASPHWTLGNTTLALISKVLSLMGETHNSPTPLITHLINLKFTN